MSDSIRALLVEARYYDHISDALAEGAMAVLSSAGAAVEQISVPGALEIPGAIAQAARSGRFDVYVALGCVIRGETFHFEIVAGESARGLMYLTIDPGLAVGNGILTVESGDQAWARADPKQKNKGGEAAEAALALHRLKQEFSAP